ncbi:MAG TPA: chlorophyllase [Actinoplanes sp.]|nr:chlorophyllase [Actinoplanes sp.]
MRRRSVLLSVLTAAAGAGGMTACASGTTGGSAGQAAPSASGVPILGSTAASSLAPQSVTPYAPPTGAAPARAFAVGRRDLGLDRGADRPLPTRVWYPATGAVPDRPSPVDGAAPATGRFPLILFSHGLTSSPEDFAALLSRWAQAGFVVAAPSFPHTANGVARFDAGDIVNQPADVRHVLDRLLALAGDPLATIIDPARLAAAGHSGGAITTTGLFSAARDERLTAGLVIAGTDFLGAPFAGPPAAMLVVHGRNDDTVAYRAGRAVFDAVPWSRAMLTVTSGGHVITSGDFEAITGTSTEFWRWSLYGDAAARSRMSAAAAAGNAATLEDQL